MSNTVAAPLGPEPATRRTPVLIVGAGPVGLTAALILARNGVASIVIERRQTAAEEGSKAICIQRDSLDICQRVGIAQPMVDRGVTWRVGRTSYRDHELFTINLPDDDGQRFPPFINISQSDTEAMLVHRARSEPLIALHYGQGCVSLRQDDAGVTVTTEAGDTYRADYVIGCDGSRSVVRKAIGATFDGRSFDEQFLIADIRCDLGFDAERRFFFDPPWNPGRQVLIHPCPDGVWRIDWQVPADFNLESEQASGALHARIQMITGDRPYTPVWLSVYRFHQRRASRFAAGRVVLAGDSAHIYAPFGARGLNAGFHDAENAAWKVAAAVQGWAGPALINSYAYEREAAADENLAVTGRTMEFLVPDDEATANHRSQVLAAASTDPLAQAQVDSGRLAEPFWYNTSPLTTGGSLDGFPTAPGLPRPVVPGVLCRDAVLYDGVTLRSTFGPQFTLVGHVLDTLGADVARSAGGRIPSHSIQVSAEVAESIGLPARIDAHGVQRWPIAVIRPDGYVAAIAESAPPLERPVLVARLAGALRTAAGW